MVVMGLAAMRWHHCRTGDVAGNSFRLFPASTAGGVLVVDLAALRLSATEVVLGTPCCGGSSGASTWPVSAGEISICGATLLRLSWEPK